MDIRNPIGLMFLLLGLLMVGWGLLTNGDTAMYAKSADININLWWGLLMSAFGAFMLGLALCAARKKAAASGEKSCGCSCSR